jgi:hypothetical protein
MYIDAIFCEKQVQKRPKNPTEWLNREGMGKKLSDFGTFKHGLGEIRDRENPRAQ